MSGRLVTTEGPRPGRRGALAGAASYLLITAAVLLGWQILIQPLMQRAPVAAAVRIAPGSPQVLGRAAEAELAAGRIDNAALLARDALSRAPFDVRALRVAGLAEARSGREARANDILTLAGNWSLRDDPAHAWLVAYRLRRGDYASSFAHADTLARRREGELPQVFQLFTTAARTDPGRALPVVASLLTARPPWRTAYLNSLLGSAGGLQVSANLAILLQSGRAPLTNAELRQLYTNLLDKGLLDALIVVRQRLDRPPVTASAVTNGGFNDASAPEPFQWRLEQRAGLIAEVMPDDDHPDDPALRVDFDGYTPGLVAEQLLLLPPGLYRLTASARVETGDPADLIRWTMTCIPGDSRVLSAGAADRSVGWKSVAATFTIAPGCRGQFLRLETGAGNRRAAVAVWFDRVAVTPIRSAAKPD